MSFLQPWLLAALPLMALPIIIHLINQRRYQSVPWGAMMFLLAANRMSRGYAKIRQWLILLFRTLAIAGLIFAISRPLASGWLGAAAGGGSETTIVLVDRSPSMQQRGDGTVVSKLDAGLSQLSTTLQTLGSKRIVLIDSGSPTPRELAQGEELTSIAGLDGIAATADIPAMLLEALDYVRANNLGQTDIWICSDLRESDWMPSDGRWQTIRESFQELPTRVRFSLLAFSQPPETNKSIQVKSIRRLGDEQAAEILVSVNLVEQTYNSTTDGGTSAVNVPIEWSVAGARSILDATLNDGLAELKEHRIPVAVDPTRGWGRVSIPADGNTSDDDYYFVYDLPPPRKTLVVSDDPATARAMELTAGIAPAAGINVQSSVLEPGQLDGVAWEELCLILWNGPMPTADIADRIENFVRRGGSVMFFPSSEINDETFYKIGWSDWQESQQGVSVESWRGDEDILANTQSGASLPVGQLKVNRWATLEGEGTALATLAGGQPLLLRAPTATGGVYFWATTPKLADSSLASDGIVLYVAVQRAADRGSASLVGTGQIMAGTANLAESVTWVRVAGDESGLSTEQSLQAGVYQIGDRLVAVNRDAREDEIAVAGNETVDSLFQGLDFDRVETSTGNMGGLVQEIWRLFLITMMVSMLVESVLCLPKVVR